MITWRRAFYSADRLRISQRERATGSIFSYTAEAGTQIPPDDILRRARINRVDIIHFMPVINVDC